MSQKRKTGQASGLTAGGFRSLFAKILLLIGGAVVVAELAVGLVLLRSVSRSVERLTMNELTAKSQTAASEINGFFERHFDIVETAADNVEIEKMFLDTQAGMPLDGAEGWPAIRQTLERVQAQNPDSLLNVWLADVDVSQLVQADGYVSEPGAWNIQQRPWFIQMKQAGAMILSEPYEDTATKLQVVTVAAPIFRPGSQEIVGAVGVDLSLEMVGNMMSSYQLGKEGFYILTAGSGRILYHPVADNVNREIAETDLSDSIKDAVLSKTAGQVEYVSHGVNSFGYVTPVGSTGWMVSTGLPEAEYRAEAVAVRTLMLSIFAVAAVVIFLLIVLIARQIINPIKKLTRTAHLIADGDLNVSAHVDSRDETGQMAAAVNRTVVQLNRYAAYIKEITKALEQMARGDMRIRLEQDYAGTFAPIRAAFDSLADSLNQTLHTIDVAAEQVAVGSDQVSAGAQALAAGSTEQAASIQELNASVEQVAGHAVETAGIVDTTVGQFDEASTAFALGIGKMGQLSGAMADIASSSNQIASITKVIEDIAFQTNILALNAAIEAARAGAAGKGFAVVADEVRNLAGKSAEAARQTAELIETAVSTVDKGSGITAETVQILKDVGTATEKVSESLVGIKSASAEQVAAIEQIREGLNQISSVVQTNAATAEENSATSEEMSAQAATLRHEVGRFTLEDGGERLYAEASAAPAGEARDWEQAPAPSQMGKY